MREFRSTDADETKPAHRRAAEYVRMSTEHQQYSTQNQNDKIREYAAHRGIEIVRTYADEGKSGLRLDGRLALQALIADVQSGNAPFDIILVYDVSRWGRFQDADESAYYEYICRRAGIQVTYCAEQFENDGSPVSTIVKGVKRAMAGEYSRELSAKVFAGQCRLIELGYRQGGTPGYGLRRVLLDQTGAIKSQLARGEHKSLQTDRVILVPGPEEEIRVIGEIYQWFIEGNVQEHEIAARLNARGEKTDLGRDWTRASIRAILSNEKYIGANVYNRVSFKLKKLRVVNAPDMWIRKDDAFEPVVSKEYFYMAQGIMRARAHRWNSDEMIERLKKLFRERGMLSGIIIDEAEDMPSSWVYAHRFGSLMRAYQLVGFTPDRDYHFLEINRLLRSLYPRLVSHTEQKIAELGGMLERDAATDLLRVNDEFSVSLVLARCHTVESGRNRWKVRFDTSLQPDITVAVRLAPDNTEPLDYYLLPRLEFGSKPIRLAEHNPVEVESFRFETLDYLHGMAARYRLKRAA